MTSARSSARFEPCRARAARSNSQFLILDSRLGFRSEIKNHESRIVNNMDVPARQTPAAEVEGLAPSSLVAWTQIIYALHAFSLLTGILGAATVVGAFLTGWPSIIAVILNYVKRSDARGTWLESHFRWQIRTFWYGLLWVSVCLLVVVVTLGIGLLIA